MRQLFLCLFLCAAAVTGAGCSCAPCSPGQATCACRDGNQCDDGAVCGADNKCIAPTLVSVAVSDANARGCELLVTEQPGTTVAFGKFNKGVVGTSVREAPRTAVTFVSAADTALPADGAQLALAAGNASGLAVTKASCVDARGAKLAGAAVTLR